MAFGAQGGTASGYGMGASGQQSGDTGTGGGGFGARNAAPTVLIEPCHRFQVCMAQPSMLRSLCCCV